MKKILLTGATGLLGRHILEQLTAVGYDVRCVVRDPNKAKRLEEYGSELVFGDLTDADAVGAAMAGVDAVIHAAAVLGGWGKKEIFLRNNLEATRNVVQAAVRNGVKRLVYVSSVATYGLQPGVHLTEDSPMKEESEPYCETKRLSEELVKSAAQYYAINTTIVRPSIIYGPYDERFIPIIVDNMRKGMVVAIGKAGQGPPLIYAKDIARFISIVLKEQTSGFEVFNLSSPERLSWENIIESIGSAMNVSVNPWRVPFRFAYGVGAVLEFLWKAVRSKRPPKVTRFLASLIGLQYDFDSSKALRVKQFDGFTPFEKGLEETLRWMKSHSLEEQVKECKYA